ncbi:penicillin-binding protein activator [Altererythrobacter sp. TH136]|uniref:penicillin-binding protein activator n=1 Tax=Altererythrobacter sp. TH136 TaxID=2067415 RepID=UPI001162A22D|nr:penicillin-binding protein activator [Altererythrobacter sp. TH136]QDM40099.1 penicillin-binding protein activator [Altererythrobacter sp. TH136]
MNVAKTGGLIDRRKLLAVGGAMLLAGCKIIPGGGVSTSPDPVPTPTPSASVPSPLPTDTARHRVALLVPMSGTNGAVGQSIANATTMALLDTSAESLRITTYDTAGGARAAAQRAVAEGNKLILGPLLSEDVGQVLAEARPANVPLITLSNDTAVAGPDVFVMGQAPEQSIQRTVDYARSRGSSRFAAIVPEGEYGQRAAAALRASVITAGGTVGAVETYARGNTSVVSAASRLAAKGGYDAVLIADGARFAAQAATVLKPRATAGVQLLGTELWSGESEVTRAAGLRGAWFSAMSDARFKRFSDSYKARFGGAPYRVSTLGYDGVLLALRIARDWKPGRSFPVARLRDEGGFLGLDGAFRFGRNGVVERTMEVREVRNGQVVIVDPAPAAFGN